MTGVPARELNPEPALSRQPNILDIRNSQTAPATI